MSHVTAVILAAGRSTRMGSPKALLPLGKTTFLGRLMTAYGQLGLPLRVVLGPDWRAITARQSVVEEWLLVNREPERGPLSSLLIALDHLPSDADAVMLHPVDHPLVDLRTIEDLLVLHEQHPERIVLPTCRGRNGHPTLFPSSVFEELRNAPLEEGARSVVLADRDRLARLETRDEGVLRNIDTPDDYSRWVEG